MNCILYHKDLYFYLSTFLNWKDIENLSFTNTAFLSRYKSSEIYHEFKILKKFKKISFPLNIYNLYICNCVHILEKYYPKIILDDGWIIVDIIKEGNLFILQYLYEHGKLIFKNGIDYIDYAAKYGKLSIIQWFNAIGYFPYTLYAITYAAGNGHLDVIKWFTNSKYPFLYAYHAIDLAANNNHIDILQWFSDSGYDFLYSTSAIDGAMRNGYLKVLEWFSNSKYEFIYSSFGFEIVCYYGIIDVLDWFFKSNQEIKYIDKCINYAIHNNQYEIIELLRDHGYIIKE